MAFTSDAGSLIDLQEGVEMTTRYREAQPEETRCIFFGNALLKDLLDQPEAAGLRFYFAHDDDGRMTLVTVATDKDGTDILAKVGNRGTRCPDYCGSVSALGNASV